MPNSNVQQVKAIQQQQFNFSWRKLETARTIIYFQNSEERNGISKFKKKNLKNSGDCKSTIPPTL